MTEPERSLVDESNDLLGGTPAAMVCTDVQTPVGVMVGMTVRTPSTTLTVFLGKADALLWAGNLRKAAARISDLAMAPPPSDEVAKMMRGARPFPPLPPVNGQPG